MPGRQTSYDERIAIMLKQQASILKKIDIWLDTVVLISAFLLAYYLRKANGVVGGLDNYVWLLLFAVPCWLSLLSHYRFYESQRTRSYTGILQAIIKVQTFSAVMLAAVIFILDPHDYSRILFAHFILISFLLLIVCKVMVKMILSRLRFFGYNLRNILIIGTGQSARRVYELVSDRKKWGLNVIEMVALADNCKGGATTGNSYPVRSVNEVVNICKERNVDEVFIAMDSCDSNNLTAAIEELQSMGLTVKVTMDFPAPCNYKTDISLFNDEIPTLTYGSISLDGGQRLAKRSLDIVGSLVGLTVTTLLLPFIALAIKLDSPGSILFGQPRVRENGRRFICWKFRTMHVNAEEQKQKLMALNEMKGAMFKVKNDPRVTRVGRFLRKFSLDEFTQFWNVLRGEMSLVGTRPPTPDEVDSYQNWHRKRISIKPGITGLWQVSGRNHVQDFDDVVRLDLLYIETWTIWLDIKILFKTPLVMLSHNGAS